MLSARFLLGAAIGGAAVYFFDPVSGAQRRAQLQSRWEQQREPIMNTTSQVASTARESARQLNEQAAAKAAELRARVQDGGSVKSAPSDTGTAGSELET